MASLLNNMSCVALARSTGLTVTLPSHSIHQMRTRHFSLPRHMVYAKNSSATDSTPAATIPSPPSFPTTPFVNVKSEEAMLQTIKALPIPPQSKAGMELFFNSYRNAVLSSGVEDAQEVVVRVMATVFDRILVQFQDPFTFPSHHRRITEPYDYYSFGQNYVRPLIDFKNSYLGNKLIFDEIDAQLKRGENVVLLANHQTEADPAVLALLLEHSHPDLATGLTYVAGDRVVLDPFCKPFSMGRNLLCIFSKKRLFDDPATAEEKMAANRKTLKEMTLLFRKGGNLIWIAPSGGRDRPDPDTDQWTPAAFDPSAVELMRRLLEDSDVPGHLYPMALLCYAIMPPPKQIEKELGEQRIIGYHGVGISVAPELDFHQTSGHTQDRKLARVAFCNAVYASVVKQYKVLEDAILRGNVAYGESQEVSLEQPWLEKGSGEEQSPAATAVVGV